jgi:hypothetical protein
MRVARQTKACKSTAFIGKDAARRPTYANFLHNRRLSRESSLSSAKKLHFRRLLTAHYSPSSHLLHLTHG